MRALILILIFEVTLVQSQNVTVQLELTGETGTGYLDYTTSICGSNSNDVGLNAIFTEHNVYRYCPYNFTAYPSLTNVEGGLVECNSCDPNSFIADLENYTTVVGRARLTPGPEMLANCLNTQLDFSIVQTGSTPQNVVITNNETLNEIFENFTVFEFVSVGNIYHAIKCDCYSPDLAAALQEANFIDEYYFEQMVYLTNPEWNLNVTKIFPIPYTQNLNIVTEVENAKFKMFDVTGKMISESHDAQSIISTAVSVNKGFYVLTVESQQGNVETFKLIKQ